LPQSKGTRRRYTPPPQKKAPPSPMWVPAMMFTMWGAGIAVVIFNYTGLLFGGATNAYLFLGLGLLTGGFLVATQYR